MHRLILQVAEGQVIDHVNGDGLDNRKSNLRACSHRENMRNRNKWLEYSSPFKGVFFGEEDLLWRCEIKADGERLRLGRFASEHAAARQYDRAARLMFGRFARTNEALGLYDKHPDRLRAKPSKRRAAVRAADRRVWQVRMQKLGIEPRLAGRR
jgi:hypothetical protein